MAGKQGEIPGTERPRIQEVDDKAEVYEKSRDKRIKASKSETEDKAALIEAMRKHKIPSYRLEDGSIVTLSEKYDVKITASKESQGEGEEAN